MRSATLPIAAFIAAASLSLSARGEGFRRAINLNGPALQIGGQRWEAEDAAPGFAAPGMQRFENQNVPLDGDPEAALAQMLRSSVWNSAGKNRIVWRGLAAGSYQVALYVWEDNDPQTYDISLNGSVVASGVESGPGGSWARLGPWKAEVAAGGEIVLESRGGHANWSGVEIWSGDAAAPMPMPAQPVLPAPAPEKPVPPTEAQVFFEQKIAPIFAKHCLECHSSSEHKGDVDLQAAAGAAETVAPGDLGGSSLWEQIESDEMPKKRDPLSGAEKASIKTWIERGAEWGAAASIRFSPRRIGARATIGGRSSRSPIRRRRASSPPDRGRRTISIFSSSPSWRNMA
ncbi:MAG: c-type cytochrome domain-containing protein [Verrucomicrobiales bacterium]